MTVDEYADLDACQMAELVSRRELQASELGEAALAAISKTNPHVNAVLEVFQERTSAIKSGGRFAGVPFLHKDLLIQQTGQLCECGSRLASGLRCSATSELALRYARAGLNTIGRTNTPEFGFNVTTEPVHCGPTRNPWSLSHSAGGSSGGAAAAVACGMVPMAHASDGGGSIRIPAACCGVVGLKPTRGRISLGPAHGTALLGLCVEHAITRSVRDSAALLDATQGASPGDPFVIPRPRRPYIEEVGAPAGRLRIAWTHKSWTGADVDPDVASAVQRTALLCEALGHHVTEAKPAIDAESFDVANTRIWTGSIAYAVDRLVARTGRPASSATLECATLAAYQYGKSLSAAELLEAEDMLNTACRQASHLFAQYDVLLTPTIGHRVASLGEHNANAPIADALDWVHRIFSYAPFTALFNATGQPAISLPLEQDRSGLPIGMQFVAGFGEEGILFRLAASLEEAASWHGRQPAIWAANDLSCRRVSAAS